MNEAPGDRRVLDEMCPVRGPHATHGVQRRALLTEI